LGVAGCTRRWYGSLLHWSDHRHAHQCSDPSNGAIKRAIHHLNGAMIPSIRAITPVATVAKAKVLARTSGTDLVEEADRLGHTILDMCIKLGKRVPPLPSDLTVDALKELQQHFVRNNGAISESSNKS
jgi:hypothetical protein